MLRPRVIPCLLIRDQGLVKTTKFKKPRYLGDPLNAVRIFNEKKVDELIILDIDATSNAREPNFSLIKDLASECQMPLCYGGGIKTIHQAKKIIQLGVEKIALSSAALDNPELISLISNDLGSQSVVIVLDFKINFFGKPQIWSNNGLKNSYLSVLDMIEKFEQLGAGEIVLNSIDRDGQMSGYDINLVKKIKDLVHIPLTILGGAGSFDHITDLLNECGHVGAAAGSLFVYKGPYKAVLINYINDAQKASLRGMKK